MADNRSDRQHLTRFSTFPQRFTRIRNLVAGKFTLSCFVPLGWI